MGCSGRIKAEDIRPEQKWEFISLNDFHSTSCFKPFAYAYLWASLFISVSVYSVDTFTAVNLLAFDRWSSEIKPYIPLNISKWIFSACIIASWVNLAFEHARAMRVMRRGAVAESYLDPLAVRLQSVRLGKGRGWKRFLVFAELTKSKKGAEYVALFSYFALKTWIRIIFCQGPRQVINAITLYSVLKVQFDSSEKNVELSILKFFKNIAILADKEKQQVLILSGMVFTLIIWGFGAFSLVMSILFYILFLWHYIPNADGGLSGYCERKINTRLAQIVSAKVNKAIEEEERKRLKADAKALAKGHATQAREATLPDVYGTFDEKDPYMQNHDRSGSITSHSLYSVRSDTPLNAQTPYQNGYFQTNERPVSPTTTISSNGSYGGKAAFLNINPNLGYNRSESTVTSFITSEMTDFLPPSRPGTSNSIRQPNGYPMQRVLPRAQYSYTASQSESTFSPDSYMYRRPTNASHDNTEYPKMNPFIEDAESQISRPATRQAHNNPAGNINPRFRAAENIRRLASPAPYLTGQIQSPGFNFPAGYQEEYRR